MLTTTSTINAAFLQEVKDDNVHLRELLAAASAAMNQPSSHIRPRALSELFQQIQDQLATHFTLEEVLGYMEDAVDAAPRLSGKAETLREEHITLYVEIMRLADDSQTFLRKGDANFPVEVLMKRFRTFCKRLKRHEADENDLIMSSLYDELGVVD